MYIFTEKRVILSNRNVDLNRYRINGKIVGKVTEFSESIQLEKTLVVIQTRLRSNASKQLPRRLS